MFRRFNDGHFLPFLVILFGSGFLYLTDNKQAGIPFVREVYLVFICALSFLYCYLYRYWLSTKHEVFVVSYVTAWIVLSALLSSINFDQPLLYGLLEERRMLHLIVFFPVFYWLMNGRISLYTLEKFLVIGFLLTALIGVLYSAGVIRPRLSVGFQVGGTIKNDITSIYEGFRSGRFRISELFLFFVYVLGLYRIRENQLKVFGLFWYAIIPFCVLYTWFVLQTRTQMLYLLLFFLIIYRKDIKKLVVLSFFGLATLILLSQIFPEVISSQIEKLNELIYEAMQVDADRTRVVTADIIFKALAMNPFGYGALSLQWNDGFRGIYNNNFYLSDVGLLGVVYRFGVFSIFFIYIYYFFITKSMIKGLKQGAFIKAGLFIMLFNMVNVLFSNTIVFEGGLIGIILAATAYVLQRRCYEGKSYTSS